MLLDDRHLLPTTIISFLLAALGCSPSTSTVADTENGTVPEHATDTQKQSPTDKDSADSDTQNKDTESVDTGSAANDTASTDPVDSDTMDTAPADIDTQSTDVDTGDTDPVGSDTQENDTETFGNDTADTDSADSDAPSTDSTEQDTADTDTTDTEDSDGNDTDWDPNLPATWGWISVIEWNDTCDQWYTKTDWAGGVRAYFAEGSSYPRSLPHTLGFIPMVASEGSCKLYDAGIIASCDHPEECFSCVDKNFECAESIHWCGQDQQCRADDEIWDGVCEDLPDHWNLGDITLEGFKETITLSPDQYDRYYSDGIDSPNDLFDDGDILTARTEGGALPSLTFLTQGVAPLEIPNTVIDIVTDQSVTVEWTPADPDSRIQVALISGSHDPNPLTASIVCDVPDSDGSVTIPAALINGFLNETCAEAMMKCSRITRYSRDVQTHNGKTMEFFVGSARNLQHSMWFPY